MDILIQNILPNAIGILMLLSLLFNFQRKIAGRTPEYIVFFVMLLLNLFRCILEPLAFLAESSIFPGSRALSLFLHTLRYMGNTIFAGLWFLYAQLRINIRQKLSHTVWILSYVPAAVLLFGYILNLFIPLFFQIAPDNSYIRLPWFPVAIIVSYLYWICGTIMAYGYAKRLHHRVFFQVVTFLAPVCIGGMVQYFHFQVSLLCVGTAIGLNAVYVGIMDESSAIDPLSGVYSRHYLNEQLSVFSTYGLFGSDCMTAGILLDIDDFKQINDRYGHLTGDDAIHSMGQILQRTVGKNGMVFRYAGDEFVILLKIKHHDDIAAAIRRIHEETDTFHAVIQKPYTLRYSIGQTVYVFGEPVMDFMKRMDDDMYRNKKEKQRQRANGFDVEGYTVNPERNCILLVDDDYFNREVLKNIFPSMYRFEEAENGREGLARIEAAADSFCAILLDIQMPEMNGLELLKILHERGITDQIPTFLITASEEEDVGGEAYRLGVMDVIEKPVVPFKILRRVQSVLELFQNREFLRAKVMGQEKQLAENALTIDNLHRRTIEALASAIEFRDVESGEHTNRIYTITRYILSHTEMGEGYTPEQIESMAIGSIMHDIGKIAISDVILKKPGKLTKEEFEIMKLHTVKGAVLLEKLAKNQNHDAYRYACDIARSHHERWDGSGYPDGLCGEEIKPWCQVASIADVYDALISPRVYKNSCDPDAAVEMIRRGECGGPFGPKLLTCFLQCEPTIRKWYQDDPSWSKPQMKDQKYTVIRQNESPREVVNVLLLTAAVRSVYDMIVSVNLSINRYVLLNAERIPEHTMGYDGIFDELVEKTALTVPESHRQLFIDTFSRENLLMAYRKGKTTVSLEFPQLTKKYGLKTLQTTVLMMEDSRNGDILDITLSRYVKTAEGDTEWNG